MSGPSCSDCSDKARVKAEFEALQCRAAEMEGALRALVIKLEAVEQSEEYMGVWFIAQLHRGPYEGPTYVDEFNRAKAVLNLEAAQ